ncbi:hypothetical protein ACHAWF_015329 [Thalassiosira exigua]
MTSNRPIELYELEVGESDFSDLRRDQALLVDFDDFATSLISLLELCELGDESDSPHPLGQEDIDSGFHGSDPRYDQQRFQQPPNPARGWNNQSNYPAAPLWGSRSAAWSTPSHTQPQGFPQQRTGMQSHGSTAASPYGRRNAVIPISTYTCRLETNSPVTWENGTQWTNAPNSSSSASMHARFSIVESNQFRELTHLALNLNIGTDKSVRLYLSSRLGQEMMENKNTQALHAEQQRRSEAAETNLIRLNKSLQEVTQSSEAEKCQIRCQAEERLQTESCSRLAEVTEVKASKDAEIKVLNKRSEKERAVLENKIRVLEDVNSKINAEKTASENENERLSTKLSYQETTNNTLNNELSSLRGQLEHVSKEKATIEKSLHQLQLQLSSLEYSNSHRDKTLTHTEAERISAEKVSADAKQALSRQQSSLDELRRRLEEAELETSRYKDLTSRYQADRLEMKKRMKEKVAMVREQGDVLVAKEKETSELKHRSRGLEENLQRFQKEKQTLSRELNVARAQIGEDKKKLENNQQVIAWLNKQLNNSSGGAMWKGGRPSNTAMSSQTASLNHHLPRASATPYRRSYVTPEFKETSEGVSQQLHPEPTPYAGLARGSNVTNPNMR